jgi:hypothetical protein
VNVEGWWNWSFNFISQFVIIYFISQQSLDGVVVRTLAFHTGVWGSIPRMNQHIFNFPFSQSHPSSIKLATSGITSPSNAERIES